MSGDRKLNPEVYRDMVLESCRDCEAAARAYNEASNVTEEEMRELRIEVLRTREEYLKLFISDEFDFKGIDEVRKELEGRCGDCEYNLRGLGVRISPR